MKPRFKKADIGQNYLIMIVLGIIGAIIIFYILKSYLGSSGPLSGKLFGLLKQSQPAP